MATQNIAAQLLSDLKRDFGLTDAQAAGVVGNLMHESGGFQSLQEQNPSSGRGGFGYAQWTGARRNAFENFAAQNGLDPTSYEANYGYLKHELNTDPYERRQFDTVKNAKTAAEAAKLVSDNFLRPGNPNIVARQNYANQALGYAGSPVPPMDIPNVVGTQLDVTQPRVAPTPASVEDRVTARNTAPPVITPLQAALNQVATRERNRVTPAPVEDRVTARNTATARADAMADAARTAALRANQSFVGQDRFAPQVTQLPRMNVPTVSASDRARGQTGQFSGDPGTPAVGRTVATIPSNGGPATSIRPSVQVTRPAVPSNITTQRNEQLATRQPTPRAINPQSQPSAMPRVNPVGSMPTFQALQDMAAQRFDPNAPNRLNPSSAIIPTNVGSIPRSQVNQIGVPALLPAIGPARAPISVPASQLATRQNIAPVPFNRPAFGQAVAPVKSPLTIRVMGSNTIPYPQVRQVPQRVAPVPMPTIDRTAQMLQRGRDAVSQSGDTSVGNQRDAAEARSSGAGGRTRRY